MKTFHVFAGADYYPSGFSDYRGSYETEEEANKAGSEESWCDWYAVIETLEDGSLSELYEKRVSRTRR